jgi:TetR/AcrR family transcriptional regulator
MDNQTKILNTAIELFADYGYDAVGVKQLANSAGVSKPTLYHYFGSKRGLLDEVLKDNFNKLNQTIQQAAEYNGDLPLTINKVITTYFDFAKNNNQFYRMQLTITFAPPESDFAKAVDQFIKEQYQIMEQLFIQAAKDHGNMKGRHEEYAASLLGMINTYISLTLKRNKVLDDELIYKIAHQFMHGIYS